MPTIPGRNGRSREDQTRISRTLDRVMASPDFAQKWAHAAEADAQRLKIVGDPTVAELEEIVQGQLEAEDRPRTTWWPQDFEDVLDGSWQPVQPTIGRRSDGAGLFYPGRTHSVVAESEAGKSWLALAAAVDEMTAGHTVVYIDFEDNRGGIVGRLLTMGVKRDLLRERFRYVHPEQALAGDALVDLLDVLVDLQPSLVILDGVTEAMAVHGLDPVGNFDAAKFGHQVTTRLVSTGAAVVYLDHVVKDREGRGRYAIGAVHKLNAISGAQYALEAVQPFGVGLTGRSLLRIQKDRPGQLRKRGLAADSGAWYGSLIVASEDEDFAEVSVVPPVEQSEDFRPTILMARVAEALARHPQGMSQRQVRSLVKGKTEAKIQALDFLILDGFASAKSPHVLLQPYAEPAPDTP